jgi:hypothetical protein
VKQLSSTTTAWLSLDGFAAFEHRFHGAEGFELRRPVSIKIWALPDMESVEHDYIGIRECSARILLRTLSVARGATATFGTGMKFLDESAEVRIGLPGILWVGGVHELVAVVVHLDSATQANHFVSVGHSRHPCLRGSVQRYLLTPLA